MCVFKLPINLFAISDQMFDVACYPWRVIRFDSYNFVTECFQIHFKNFCKFSIKNITI